MHRLMSHYLELNLDEVTVDPELAKRVPYGLAMYYLALPLAQENDHVSVALAHPENTTALTTLRNLLQAEIVPVRSQSDKIRTALQRLHGLNGKQAQRVMMWSATPEHGPAVRQMAATFAKLHDTPAPVLDAGQVEIDVALAVAQESHATLVVLSLPPDRTLHDMVSRCSGSLVVVQGEYPPIKSILVAARGYASDDQLLDWLEPLVRQQRAQVTLFPLLGLPTLDLDDIFCGDGPAKRHLDHLLQRLTGEHMAASLRVRAGDPVAQVVAELREGAYDLLVIAAEGYGQFVTRVLAALQHQGVHQDRPIFILKPTDMPVRAVKPQE